MEKLLRDLGTRFFEDPQFREEVTSKNGKINKKAKLLFLMVQDYIAGRYTRMPKTAVVLAAGLAAYFVVGNAIPGYLDEMAAVTLVMTALGSDIEDYRVWREAQASGDVEVRVTIGGVKFHLDKDQVTPFIKENLKEAVYDGLKDTE